jgi:hypothetical protein
MDEMTETATHHSALIQTCSTSILIGLDRSGKVLVVLQNLGLNTF